MLKPNDRSAARHVATLRGVGKMAVDATIGVTELVQALHLRVAHTATRPAGAPATAAIDGVTRLVYGGVRGVARAVGGGLDALLRPLQTLLVNGAADASAAAQPNAADAPATMNTRTRAALLAALNGVLGDYLARTANPLAIRMALRRDGQALDLDPVALARSVPQPSGRLLLLVHGLCMNDLQWQRAGADGIPHDHGAALARDLGFSPVYLHYNSGLHVSTNGRALSGQLAALVAAWPVPVESLVVIGHSMGGLVARSAVHYGTEQGADWVRRLSALVFLGTPHHGAPLERGGHWIDVLLQSQPYTEPFARLGMLRSAGITDLRHGNVRDEDWSGHDRFARGKAVNHDPRLPLPLPADVACYAVAGTTATMLPAGRTDARTAPEVAARIKLPGDGLVPVASALGRHAAADMTLRLAAEHWWIAPGTGHLDLLSSPAVSARLRDWLAPPAASTPERAA